MRPSDFLHKDASTQLCEHYMAAGAICSFSTNCQPLLDAANTSFLPLVERPGSLDFSVRFWVDETEGAGPLWPKPYVRGLKHLVFAGFDEGSSILADLRTRRVIGRFSAGMAADRQYWQAVIFPMLLTIMGASVGLAELHCACVAKNQQGMLLAGPSGAGKSTLALALSQLGFGFLSDDRTFCSVDNGEVQGWGLQTRLKLRPDAVQWFEELQDEQLSRTWVGDPSIWLEPENLTGVRRLRRCQPTSLIFLERQNTAGFKLSPMSSAEALSRLTGELMAELPDALKQRSGTIRKVVELPCWRLRYGGQPHAIARQISRHLARS